MEVGIGLPSTIPGVRGADLTAWARRAESRGFSTLGTIDRIAYPNYEPLLALTAAAAVTERIRLTTAILLAPSRVSAGVIAKQAATLDHLSGGRLVLGMAVGGREDDYEATGAPFHQRGKLFDDMLQGMDAAWSDSVGPKPPAGRPQIVIGGNVHAAFERAARHGDGWIQGGGTPEMLGQGAEKARAAFEQAGRTGKPRIMGLAYYVLGASAEEDAERYLGDYYAFLGDYASQIVSGAAKDGDTVRGYADAFEQAGCDELIFFPSSSNPEQVDLLADAVLER